MRALLLALLICSSSNALAGEFELNFGGRLQSNIRFRPTPLSTGDWYDLREFDAGVARNEHILKLRLNAGVERFFGVVDVDFVWLGFSPEVNEFSDLSQRSVLEQTRLEAHAAYVEAVDLFVPGFDLRVGQQIVAWGVGDQFNPTNTLNPEDLEDRLLFGTQQANMMVRADYTLADWFTLSGVVVPVFRPALLPPSAELAFAAIDRLPHLDDDLRYRLLSEAAVAERGVGGMMRYPTVVRDVEVELPETNFKNLQYMARFATTLLEQDLALSYYSGREDIPQPMMNTTRQVMNMRCNPDDPADCIDGFLETTAVVGFPKIQVAGLNLAGEIPMFDIAIGYRLELGVYFPREKTIRMYNENISIAGMTIDGEYDYGLGDGVLPLVLDDTPYAKWVLGLDYTFNEYFYVNVQWVHGFADESGAGDWISGEKRTRAGSVAAQYDPLQDCINPLDPAADPAKCAVEIRRNNIGDYLVLGLDFRFLNGDGLLRLFAILDLTGYVEERWSMSQMKRIGTYYHPFSPEGFSAVLFPELNYNFGYGFELGLGGLVFLGKDYTKFGDPAAGGTVVWTRGRFSF